MRKLLLINNGYPSATRPNYVTYIQSIEECLQGAGFKVDLLVLDSNFNSSRGKYIQFFKYYWKALFYSGYQNYAYVYINNYPYSFLPLIPNFWKMRRIIIHWHGDDIFPGSWFSKILNWLSYRFIRKDCIHLVPSNYFANQTARRLKIDFEKVFVSPSGGVDTEVFQIIKKAGSESDVVRLGFASGLLRAKGMDLVLALLAEVKWIEAHTKKKIEFHFIEYGKESAYYVSQLSRFPNIVKHAPYPIKGMINFYSGIDILLFPSLRDAESLGLVVLEAMACDIPVVATDNFALKDIVINQSTGQRFTMNDIIAFRQAVVQCINRLPLYEPRNFVTKNFSKQSVIEGYKRILTER
jgi:glycosyltransferase involved in cell wall biosynthesis